jgi:serine/threonine-protein kinase
MNRGRTARWTCIALVSMGSIATMTTVAVHARADGSSDNKAAAQVLFERGRELVERNRFAEACPQFAESQRLDPGIGTLLWLADCYENVGQMASAWMAFSQAATEAAERHDARETVARDRAGKLEASLAHLTVFVSPEAAAARDLQIHCDGVVLSSGNWGRPIPLDPGSHTITANAANGRLWWKTLELATGSSSTSITVPGLAERTTPEPAAPVPGVLAPSPVVTGPASEPASTPAGRSGHTQRLAGIAIGSVGAASVLVGSIFSLRAKAKYDDSNAGPCLPDNECTAAGFDDRRSASSMATVATVAMSGGAALLVGAAAVYLAAPKDMPVKVAVSATAGGGALALAWPW